MLAAGLLPLLLKHIWHLSLYLCIHVFFLPQPSTATLHTITLVTIKCDQSNTKKEHIVAIKGSFLTLLKHLTLPLDFFFLLNFAMTKWKFEAWLLSGQSLTLTSSSHLFDSNRDWKGGMKVVCWNILNVFFFLFNFIPNDLEVYSAW